MVLLQNQRILAQYPVKLSGGVATSNRGLLASKTETNLNKFVGDATIAQFNSTPVGYTPGTTWSPSKISGGLGVYNGIEGSSTFSNVNLAGGKNASSTLSGSGEITDAAMGLITSAVATLIGEATLTANLAGKLEVVADLVGSGDVDAALGALAGLTMELHGSGQVTGSATGKGHVSADITPFTELSPESLAAKVWSSLAASFDEAGTMGQKLNAAGTAGDPWTATVPGAYAEGTAGHTLGEYLDAKISSIAASNGMTVAEFLALK